MMKTILALLLFSTGLHAQTGTWISHRVLTLQLASGATDPFRTLTFKAPVLGASTTITFPASNTPGSLQNDGTGLLSWSQGSMPIYGAGIAMGTAGTTNFYTPVSTAIPLQTTDATGLSRMWITRGGTIRNFYVSLSIAPGASNSRTFTLTKNGTAQAVTCAISGAVITANDLTHSFAVSAGDEISIKVVSVKGGGNIGAGVPQWVFEVDYP